MQSESIGSDTETVPQMIHLMILMADGNQCQISLPLDAPLMGELFQALMNRSQNQADGKLFKIPIDEGCSSLYFSVESLVGIATDPPMEVSAIIQQSTQKKYQAPTTILESNYVQVDNVLGPDEYEGLLDYVLYHKSPCLSPDRENLLSPESFAEWRSLLIHRVETFLPDVLVKLGIGSFPFAQIETEPLPTSDRQPHHSPGDNSSPENATKVLSFIYYFYREPKPFTGGEFLIYDSQIVNNLCVPAESFKTVEPRNNSLIFFLSSYLYEVLPTRSKVVSSPDGDSYFKLKGWLRR